MLRKVSLEWSERYPDFLVMDYEDGDEPVYLSEELVARFHAAHEEYDVVQELLKDALPPCIHGVTRLTYCKDCL